MTPRKRWIVLMLAAAAGLAASWLGWFETPKGWRQATGWQRIPVEQRPRSAELWIGDEPAPELRWLGHAGFELTWYGQRLLIDPNTSSWCTVSKRVLERSSVHQPSVDQSSINPSRTETAQAASARADELGKVDAVLISHAHFDHLDLPTLASISTLHQVVVPPGCARYLDGKLDDNTRVVTLEPGPSLRLGGLEIIATSAAHNGNRLHPLASREQAVGYVIRSPKAAVYYAGDTGFGDHFATVARTYKPRVAILPIGAFAPRWPLAAYHLSPEDAVAAAEILGVEAVVPSHFGTFTLSLDRPSWALPRFAKSAHAAGLRWVMPSLAPIETRQADLIASASAR